MIVIILELIAVFLQTSGKVDVLYTLQIRRDQVIQTRKWNITNQENESKIYAGTPLM